MSDSKPWWKLWTSVLTDAKIRALDPADFGRWCYLGVWLRLHGEGGSALLSRPGHGLVEALTSRSWTQTRAILARLPGVDCEVVETDKDGTPKTLRVSMRNWTKYQDDTSWERMRRKRQRDRDELHQPLRSSLQPDRNESDGVEERRGEENPPSPHKGPKQPAPSQPRLSTAQQRRHADLAIRLARPIAGSTAPREAWRYDCPDKRYHGRCVDRAWAIAHPDVSMPVVPDDLGGYRPRECPHHKAQP